AERARTAADQFGQRGQQLPRLPGRQPVPGPDQPHQLVVAYLGEPAVVPGGLVRERGQPGLGTGGVVGLALPEPPARPAVSTRHRRGRPGGGPPPAPPRRQEGGPPPPRPPAPR